MIKLLCPFDKGLFFLGCHGNSRAPTRRGFEKRMICSVAMLLNNQTDFPPRVPWYGLSSLKYCRWWRRVRFYKTGHFCALELVFLVLFQQYYLIESSNALTKNTRFKVSHPFHPLAGQEFILITYRQNWGEDRVYFQDNQGKLTSIPAQWTSLFPDDPWVSLSTSQSYFRVPDLLELAQLIKSLYATSDGSSCTKKIPE